MAKYRVLSLDGGGIRGIITVLLMQRLSKEPKLAGWLKNVRLVAGTSTGGLLALGLAKGAPGFTFESVCAYPGSSLPLVPTLGGHR